MGHNIQQCYCLSRQVEKIFNAGAKVNINCDAESECQVCVLWAERNASQRSLLNESSFTFNKHSEEMGAHVHEHTGKIIIRSPAKFVRLITLLRNEQSFSLILMERNKISSRNPLKNTLHQGYKLVMSLSEMNIWSPKSHPEFWIPQITIDQPITDTPYLKSLRA